MMPVPQSLSSVIDEDGAAIFDVERNLIVTLNSTGGFIWSQLAQGKSVANIVGDLARLTDTDPHLVADDVHVFLDQLAANRLLSK